MATTKATKFPIANNCNCAGVMVEAVFRNLYPVAAAIVGTAKKNENSAATFRSNLCCIPPIILAALLTYHLIKLLV